MGKVVGLNFAENASKCRRGYFDQTERMQKWVVDSCIVPSLKGVLVEL